MLGDNDRECTSFAGPRDATYARSMCTIAIHVHLERIPCSHCNLVMTMYIGLALKPRFDGANYASSWANLPCDMSHDNGKIVEPAACGCSMSLCNNCLSVR